MVSQKNDGRNVILTNPSQIVTNYFERLTVDQKTSDHNFDQKICQKHILTDFLTAKIGQKQAFDRCFDHQIRSKL